MAAPDLIAKEKHHMIPEDQIEGWRDLRSQTIGKLTLVVSVQSVKEEVLGYRITVYAGASKIYAEEATAAAWHENMAGQRLLPVVAAKARAKLDKRQAAFAKPDWRPGSPMAHSFADIYRQGWRACNAGIKAESNPYGPRPKNPGWALFSSHIESCPQKSKAWLTGWSDCKHV